METSNQIYKTEAQTICLHYFWVKKNLHISFNPPSSFSSQLRNQAGMRPSSHHQQQQQQAQQQHHAHAHHAHAHNNKSPAAPITMDHCCSCNNCNNYSNSHAHAHSHHSAGVHAGGPHHAGVHSGAPPPTDKDYYNLCECTSCRNLGNSIDICCQCCSCSAESYVHAAGPRYHVASMAMQEDTLEVCLQQQTADSTADLDDIALAHNMAERGNGCYECHPPTSTSCCAAPGGRGGPHRGPPLFHGWQQQQQQHQNQQRRPQLKGHSCGKGIKGSLLEKNACAWECLFLVMIFFIIIIIVQFFTAHELIMFPLCAVDIQCSKSKRSIV